MKNLCEYRADYAVANNSNLKNQIRFLLDTTAWNANTAAVITATIYDESANLISTLSLKTGNDKSAYQKTLDASQVPGSRLSVVITRTQPNTPSAPDEMYEIQIQCPQPCATQLKNRNVTLKLVAPFVDYYKTGSKGVAHFTGDSAPLLFRAQATAQFLPPPYHFSLEAWVQTAQPGIICQLGAPYQFPGTSTVNNPIVLYIDDTGCLALNFPGIEFNYRMGQGGNLMDGNWHFVRVEITTSIAMSIDGHVQSTTALASASYPSVDLGTCVIGGASISIPGSSALAALPGEGKFSGNIAMFAVSSLTAGAAPETSYALSTDMYFKGNTSQAIPNALIFIDFSDGQFRDLTGRMALSSGTKSMLLGQVRPGDASYAVRVLGRTQYVHIPKVAAYLYLCNQMTFECWVNTTRGGALLSNGAYTDTNGIYSTPGFRVHIDADGTVSGLVVVAGDTTAHAFATQQPSSLTDGAWHHLAITIHSSTICVYVDGRQLAMDQPGVTFCTSDDFYFGAPPDQCLNPRTVGGDNGAIPDALQVTDMLLSELRLWNVIRSQAQILACARRTLVISDTDAQAHLYGYWPLANGIVADESGICNQTQNVAGCEFKRIPTLCRPAQHALQLPNHSSVCNIPADVHSPIGNGPFTVEMWMRVTGHDSSHNTCVFKCPLSGLLNNSYFLIYIPHDSSRGFNVFYQHPGTSENLFNFASSTASASFLNQQWHHIAVTFDGVSRFHFYVDGVDQGTPTMANSDKDNASVPYYLLGNVGDRNWTGEVAELRIWSTCRPQPAILDAMHQALTGTEPDLSTLINFNYGQAIDQVSYSSGMEPNTTTTINPSTVPIQVGQTAFYADGQQAYLDGGSPSALNFAGTQPYTIAAWICPSSDNASGVVLSNYKRDVEGQYELALNDGYVLAQREAAPPAGSDHVGWAIKGATRLAAGRWYFVATTYDGVSLSVYVNGNLESSSDYPAIGNGSSECRLWIGAQEDPNGLPERQFQGEIAEIMIWNQAIAPNIIWALGAGQVAEKPPRPLCWWDFTSGQLTDRGSAQINLTPSASATFILGGIPARQSANAMFFNGSNQFIQCKNASPALAFSNQSFSLECWFKIIPIQNDVQLTRTLIAQGGSYQLQTINTGSGNYSLRFVTNGLSNSALDASQPPIADGCWHAVAAVYNAATHTKTIYLDGVLVAQATGITGSLVTSDSDRFTLGADQAHAQCQFFSGFITEVRAWSKALDLATDIAPHLGRKLIGLEEELAGYWKCANVVKTSQTGGLLHETDLSNHGSNGIYQNMQDNHVSDLVLLPPLPVIKSYSRLLQTWSKTDVAQNSTNGTSVYRTVINVIDANGNPMVAQDIQIWSTDPIDLITGDLVHGISATLSAKLRTDSKGQIAVDIYAESLGVSPLKIWAPFMRSDERVIICPDQHVLEAMETIQGSDLQQPRNSQPPLLDSQTSAETANSLAQAINSVSKTIQPLTPTDPAAAARGARKRAAMGASLDEDGGGSTFDIAGENYSEGGGYTYVRPVVMDADAGFSLDYRGYTSDASADGTSAAAVRFRRMSRADIQAHLDAIADHPRLSVVRVDHEAMFSLTSLWHRFVRAVNQVEQVVYHAVSDGVQIVVHWGEELGNEITQFIVTFGHAIGQSIVGLFNQVINAVKQSAEDFTKKIVAWFQEEFGWEDVLRTKTALKTLVNDGLDVAIAQMGSLVPKINEFFNTLEANVEKDFNELMAKIGDTSFNQLKDPTRQPISHDQCARYMQLATIGSHTGTFSVENSWLPSFTGQHLSSGNVEIPAFDNIGDDFVQKAAQFLGGLSEQFHNDGAVQALEAGVSYFMQIREHPDSFGQLALKGFLTIVEGFLLAGLEIANTIIDLLVELITEALTAIKGVLNQAIYIPGVSWLYKEVITDGDELSTLDFTCLLAAIPTTYICKAINGRAPFQEAPQPVRIPGPHSAPLELVATPISSTSRDIMVAYTVLSGIWGLIDVGLDIQQVMLDEVIISPGLKADAIAYGAGSGNGSGAGALLGRANFFNLEAENSFADGTRRLMKGLGMAFPCVFQGLSVPSSDQTDADKINWAFWAYKWLFPGLDFIWVCGDFLKKYNSLPDGGPRNSTITSTAVDAEGYWDFARRTRVDIMRSAWPGVVTAMGAIWIGLAVSLFAVDGVRVGNDDPDEREWALFALGNTQNLLEGISPAMKFLRLPWFVEDSTGSSLVLLGVTDLIADWGSMAMGIARLAVVQTTE